MRRERRQGPANEEAAPTGPVLTRRQAIGRVSKGAAMVGLAAWVTPEILVATPHPAGALSPPPGGGGGAPGGGSPGPVTSPGGSGPTGSAPTGSGVSGSVGVGTSVTAGSAGVGASAAASDPGPALQAASGASLPFTGFDAVRDVEIGGALVAGGWLLHRWAGRADGDVPAGPGADAG